MRRLLPLLCLACALAGTAVATAQTPPPALDLAPYARVEIETTKTSIYIGLVTMTMPPFARQGATYASTYAAKVFPYFFYNERGELAIDFSDEMLGQLARGEPVEFHGLAHNTDGEERKVEGRAVPTDALSGKIKVRVFVTKKIQLIFNTTYRFQAAAAVPAPPAG